VLLKSCVLTRFPLAQVSAVGRASLPSWLHWDPGSRALGGLPLEEDRGLHYISVSSSSSSSVFSIEVRPDERPDPEAASPSACGAERPVTLLTVILDADLAKMSARQRLRLLEAMSRFSGVELWQMKLLPVVNNRLFDMSAFMAGPGNAKKVSATRPQLTSDLYTTRGVAPGGQEGECSFNYL